ncbi:DUF4367 domain-containing protein [Candidatus Saccharibacteria bacterium]|nr:DUF4367 domain-containing protein [Candidatus Saccharibacteria bacterium]MBR6122223.1 DUF4367 domain-containing protein [Candidatus Saccharibacteria bacterium]
MENDNPVDHTSISSSASHRRVQRSTTLNRKYVKKPEKVAAVDSVAKRRADDLKRRQALADKINRERLAALKAGKTLREAAATPAAPTSTPRPLSATIERNLITSPKAEKATKVKDSAVKSALKSVASMDADSGNKKGISTKRTLGAKKLLLAFGCAALAVGIVGYFVSVNTPDISVRVAAMQSGIDATYPTYIPRGYSLSDIVSEDKKISMTFNDSESGSFTLSEEKTSWDNETLEASYVKSTWGNNYTSVREQGITIFISGSNATWINGNILYKIQASGNNLTKKQIKSIVTSL